MYMYDNKIILTSGNMINFVWGISKVAEVLYMSDCIRNKLFHPLSNNYKYYHNVIVGM